MCCTRLAGNTGRINDAKIRHLCTIAQLCRATSSQLRHVSTIEKPVKQQYVFHMSSQYGELNFGPLTPEIGSGVCGTPANFNGFRVLASLLQRRRSLEANQTLHDIWPSPGLVHYIYIFGGSCPLTEFCQVENSLYVQVLRSPTLAALLYCTALEQTASAKICQLSPMLQRMELRNFRRGRHLYSAGRPSRWASAHILVLLFILRK